MDGLAAEQPVVIVVEDAHTLSGAMLDLIERLGTRPRGGGRRSLTLALTRTELLDERPSWGSNAINAVLLRMDPLSMDEAIVLARQAGGGLITDDEAIAIAERTGGNPFFIVETTGMLLPENDGGPRMSGGALPPTVQAVVTARLDALPPRLRTLTRRASVFRYSFDLDELLSIDPDVTTDELHQLQEAEIVVRQEGAGTPYWRMRHSMLRDVAYGSLPKRERMRLHTTIADRLISLGYHSFAAEHLELAARASLDLNPLDRRIPDRAVDQLILRRRSRPASDAQPGRGRPVRAGAGAWPAPKRRGACARAARSAVSARPATGSGNTKVRPRCSRGRRRWASHRTTRSRWRWPCGSSATSRSTSTPTWRRPRSSWSARCSAAERLGDPWAIARTLLFAGWVPWTRDRYDDAEAIWQRALEVADPEDRWARIRALTALSINHDSRGDLEVALDLIEDAAVLADDAGDQFSVAVVTVQRARVIEDLGRMDEALAAIEPAISIFEELGARWELADALAERGILKREVGRLDEAEDDLRVAIRISEDLGERQLAGWTWTALARVAERRGDEAEAKERFRRAEEAEARRPR